MTTRLFRMRATWVLTSIIAIAAMSSGCYNPFSPRIAAVRGVSVPPPVPSTPAGVLRLFEWCYNNRNAVIYRELFTEDYRFFFAAADSSGDQYSDQSPFTRNDELISTSQLFQGGSESQPAASSIFLKFDKTLRVYPDGRTGKNGRWHKTIRTSVLLKILTPDGNAIAVTGDANYFLARGDSVFLPQELKDRGFSPDSNRWYIERWEDETLQPAIGGLAASGATGLLPGPLGERRPRVHPSRAEMIEVTWGWVKSRYRSP